MRHARTAAAIVTAAVLLVLLRRRYSWPLARFNVEGESMTPTYQPGDRVLVDCWSYRRRPPRAGEAVVLRDPALDDRWLVKRVAFDVRPGDPIYVLGDNAAASRDSRHFGEVPLQTIVGRVVFKY